MDIQLKHIGFRTADIAKAKDFYVKILGLEFIEEMGDNFFAVKSGGIRFSFFGGYKRTVPLEEDNERLSVIFQTGDIVKLKEDLLAKGIRLFQDIIEAPGFMKFISVEDPDGNIIHFGEYLRDPLLPETK